MKPLTPAQKQLYDWLVAYINENHYPPSIRQMMKAMNLRSPAPVQSRLERLREKGYVDWIDGKARTLRIVQPPTSGLTILGAIAAGGLVEPFTDETQTFDWSDFQGNDNYYALQFKGNSMEAESIADGDVAILRRVAPDETINNGAIVAVKVKGDYPILRHYKLQGDAVTLTPSSLGEPALKVLFSDVEVQGVLVAVWRGV